MDIVEPAVVSAVVTTVLAPLLFFLLKRRDERSKRTFEVRYAEYRKYLHTLEEIVAVTRLDFEHSYMTTVAEVLKKLLSDPDHSNEHLLELNKALDEMGSKVRESFTKATSELHGLRLVCSEKLLKLVDEFVQLQRELMNEAIAVMGNAKSIDINKPQLSMTGTMKEKAKRAEPLFDEILKQMRKELGVSGS